MEELNLKYLTDLAMDRDYKTLMKLLGALHPVDIALFLEELSGEKSMVVFRMLPKATAADVFSRLSPRDKELLIEAATDQELAVIVEELDVDEAVDALEELPANVVKRILKNARPDTRALLNQFLNYPENSAGSIMTAEFADLGSSMTVQEALARLRRPEEDRGDSYTCYVVDSQRMLEGVVSINTLLLTPDAQTIRSIMTPGALSVHTSEDREEVAQLFSRYALLSLPVVDREGRLVGVVTVDDAVSVLEREATEDFERMAAMQPSEQPYLKTGVFTLARHRILWLLVLMLSGIFTGSILGRYEASIAVLPVLVTFVPMLTDTGGNAGSQSSTLVIRGLALSEIRVRDFGKVLWKELRVAGLVGLVLGAVTFLRIVTFYSGNVLLALTVSLSLFAVVVASKTIGGVLPLVAKLCHADPAIMAAPLITTIVDAVGLFIYFRLAVALLGV